VRTPDTGGYDSMGDKKRKKGKFHENRNFGYLLRLKSGVLSAILGFRGMSRFQTSLSEYERAIDECVGTFQSSRVTFTEFNEVHAGLLSKLDEMDVVKDSLDLELLGEFRQRIGLLRAAQSAFRLDVKVAESCKMQRLGVGADGTRRRSVNRAPTPAQALVENSATLAARKRKLELDEMHEPFVPLLEAVTSKRCAASSDIVAMHGQLRNMDTGTAEYLTNKSFRFELLRRLENNVREVLSL
jgi:hypothetical protein